MGLTFRGFASTLTARLCAIGPSGPRKSRIGVALNYRTASVAGKSKRRNLKLGSQGLPVLVLGFSCFRVFLVKVPSVSPPPAVRAVAPGAIIRPQAGFHGRDAMGNGLIRGDIIPPGLEDIPDLLMGQVVPVLV